MYKKNLSEIFIKSGYTQDDYPWGFHYEPDTTPANNIFYVLGCSWWFRSFFPRVFMNNYKDYMLINRSVAGMTNSLIVDTLQNDIALLRTTKKNIVFLICFSEVGRSIHDLAYANPKSFESMHDYFGSILKEQYKKVYKLIHDHKNFITTSFISNNFNSNKSLVDFCGKANLSKPNDVYSVYGNGMLEFCKDRGDMFNFNFNSDLQKSLDLKKFLLSLEHIDESLHPNHYKPYELFLENVFNSL